MIRALAGQSVGAEVVNATTGAAFNGAVTVFVTLDAGTQAQGTVGSGSCTNEGNGFYTYLPSAAETDGQICAFTFVGSGAIPATSQYATITAQQFAAITSGTISTSTTVRRLITAALKRINIIQYGESPADDMMADAFDRFNDWVDSVCSNDRLLIFSMTRTVFTMTAGKGTIANPYTVGDGGDVDITRPQWIDHLNYQDTSTSPTTEYPLWMLTDDAWSYIPQKDLTGTLPVYAYYNPTYTSGLGTLNFWLVPTQTTLQGVMYWPQQVTRFASIDDSIALPPGYNRFLRDGLAVELAPEMRDGVPLDPGIIRSADQAKRALKTLNLRPVDLLYPYDLIGTTLYNINTDSGSY